MGVAVGGLSARSRPGAGTMHKLHVEDISQVLAGRVDKVECGPESVHMRNVIDQKSGGAELHRARPIQLLNHQPLLLRISLLPAQSKQAI